MYNFSRYSILLIILTLIQVCFMDRLQIGIYVQPLIYIAFIVILPMQLTRMNTLLIGAICGFIIDLCSGTPGINTIATTAVAYLRPLLLRSIFGYEEVREGGVPSVYRGSPNAFLNYTLILLSVHSLIYFAFDAMSWSMVGPILLRSLINVIICMPIAYLTSSAFANR